MESVSNSCIHILPIRNPWR